MKNKNLVLVFMFIILFSSCADVTIIHECTNGNPYGFWSGFWHGIISPISFIGSLFSENIAMYAVNNNGGWYDFGFASGAGILFGLGRKS